LILINIGKMILIAAIGVLWLLASGISRKLDGLEKVILAASLGITSLFLIASFTIVTRLPSDLVVFSVSVLTIIGLVAVWLYRRPRTLHPKMEISKLARYWLPLCLFSFHVALWAIYFTNYPYFPNSDAIDVVWHSDITNQVLQGSIVGPVAAPGFPAGSHILFAFVSQFLGLDVLSSLRVTAAVIESLSVLVACCLFRRLFSSRLAADYAAVSFALVIPSGFIYYAKIGAYPNIIGDFFVLTSLLIAAIVMQKATARPIVTAAIIQAVALFSHISVIVFGGLVILFAPVVWIRYRSKFRAYFLSNLGFFVFPTVALIFASRTVAAQVTYTSTLYLDLNNNVGLVFQQWLHNYVLFAGPLGFLLVIIAAIWVRVRLQKRLWPSFFAGWFTLLFLMVFVSTNDWRLALLSMVPGAGLLGLFLSRLHEAIEKLATPRFARVGIGKSTVVVLMLFLILVLAVQGPTAFVVSQDLASRQASVQSNIYDSMTWIQTHTQPDTAVVSVGLQREYQYLPVITNRTYRGDFNLDSEGILKLQTEFTFRFAAVSNNFSGLNSFYGSNNFRTVYQNPDVVIFELIK